MKFAPKMQFWTNIKLWSKMSFSSKSKSEKAHELCLGDVTFCNI